MELHIYLATKRMSVKNFAQLVDCAPSYISRVSRGNCIPGRKLARNIEKVTEGQVIFDLSKIKQIDTNAVENHCNENAG